ncbi:MAG: rod shape-determining protein MreC [Candidatus Moranbacteria bacterium RIFCSPHIGHO2_01_FULL_55_24]|nr:MAG: rod shape-determining protein MreC [Candidatus Moranbacteria bacterium RIFCSPHIGHO2_01_FULL_55_24]
MAVRRTFTQTKFFWALLSGAILGIFLIFQPIFLTTPLRYIAATVMWPVQNVLAPVAFEARDVSSFFGSIGELKETNETLEKEKLRLLAENARLQDLGKENEELRRSLNLIPRDRFETIGAGVIGRDVSGLGNWIQIDQGSLDGVEKGMAVIVEAGVMVGRIEEVFPKSARVMLLSHPESMVNGVTVDTDAQGIVKGEHGLGIVYDMVIQADTLKNGDTVVTSGLGGTIPKGLLIGTLQDTRLSDDRLFQQGAIVLPVRFDHLRYVFVIKRVIGS